MGEVGVGGGDEGLGRGLVGWLQEFEEVGAALGVEFSEDIVDEQDGRGIEGLGEEVGLSDAEGDRCAAFLAFAGEIGGGEVVDGDAKIVSVRADYGGLHAPFAIAALLEFLGEVGFDVRGVVDGEFVVMARDGPVGFRREAVDFWNESSSAFHNKGAEAKGLMIEGLKGGLIDSVSAQEGVSRADGARVFLDDVDVVWLGLGEDEIDEAAPDSRGAGNELGVFWGKNYYPDGVEEFRDPLRDASVDFGDTFVGRPVEGKVAWVGRCERSPDEVAFGAALSHLLMGRSPEGAECGEQVNGLEEAGFALGVRSGDEMRPGSEVDIETFDISKRFDAQMGQAH